MAVNARKHDGKVQVDIDLALGPAETPVPVQVSIDAHGLSIRRKGRRLALRGNWDGLIPRMVAPAGAAAKYLSNPMGLLLEDS